MRKGGKSQAETRGGSGPSLLNGKSGGYGGRRVPLWQSTCTVQHNYNELVLSEDEMRDIALFEIDYLSIIV